MQSGIDIVISNILKAYIMIDHDVRNYSPHTTRKKSGKLPFLQMVHLEFVCSDEPDIHYQQHLYSLCDPPGEIQY